MSGSLSYVPFCTSCLVMDAMDCHGSWPTIPLLFWLFMAFYCPAYDVVICTYIHSWITPSMKFTNVKHLYLEIKAGVSSTLFNRNNIKPTNPVAIYSCSIVEVGLFLLLFLVPASSKLSLLSLSYILLRLAFSIVIPSIPSWRLLIHRWACSYERLFTLHRRFLRTREPAGKSA